MTDTWDLYPFDGAELSLFEGIEIAPTGEVIIRAYNGVATMTDHAWAVTPLDADVSFGLAPAIGSSPNGDIWFYVPAPPDMIALFKPRSGQWTYFGPDSRSTDANLRVTLTEHLGIQYAFFNTTRNDGFEGTQLPAGWPLVDRHEFSDSEFREITLRGWIEDATMCLDGTVWISHSFGISSLNPSTEEWRYYDPSEALGFLPQIGSITCSSTGEVWVAAEEAHPLLIRLDPPAERGALPTWTIYDPRDGLPDEESLQGVYVDREGAVWIGYGSSHITARCSLR